MIAWLIAGLCGGGLAVSIATIALLVADHRRVRQMYADSQQFWIERYNELLDRVGAETFAQFAARHPTPPQVIPREPISDGFRRIFDDTGFVEVEVEDERIDGRQYTDA